MKNTGSPSFFPDLLNSESLRVTPQNILVLMSSNWGVSCMLKFEEQGLFVKSPLRGTGIYHFTNPSIIHHPSNHPPTQPPIHPPTTTHPSIHPFHNYISTECFLCATPQTTPLMNKGKIPLYQQITENHTDIATFNYLIISLTM